MYTGYKHPYQDMFTGYEDVCCDMYWYVLLFTEVCGQKQSHNLYSFYDNKRKIIKKRLEQRLIIKKPQIHHTLPLKICPHSPVSCSGHYATFLPSSCGWNEVTNFCHISILFAIL